jgi:phosphodiester glycosidase
MRPRKTPGRPRRRSAPISRRTVERDSKGIEIRIYSSMVVPGRDGIEYLLWRHALADGEVTTMYAVRYSIRSTRARVVHFPRPERLDVWCRRHGAEEAVVAGFFLRDPYRPLGELWIGGRPVAHESIAAPYAARRASVAIDDGRVRLLERGAAPALPAGDLVQAGPMLVAGGSIVFDPAADAEGFSAGAGQFDSDITAGRYPRAALGLSSDSLFTVACDGRRSNVDGGLTMLELAAALVELGADSAINLDGGGSTTLVHRGHLLNRPYSTQDQPAPESRGIVSALVFAV